MDSEPLPGMHPIRRSVSTMVLEIAVLLAVCGVTFFVGLDRFDFIKTEGLRAIVVAEMLERPGLTLPTVHEVPYLKKPPLYAWTTTLLARCVGRFDEQIARLPSAVCATVFLLLMYAVGETWIGRRGGWSAACLAALNVTLVDYGSRAELDMGFALFSTLTLLLAWPALRRRGGSAAACWLGVYAAATAASFWKGPHVLIFLGLTLLCWGWVKKQWGWLRNPGPWIGLTGCLGLLIWWTKALSAFAGEAAVGKTATREFIARLVPLQPDAWLSILWYGPALAIVSLPASLFVMAGLRRGVTGVEFVAPVGGSKLRNLPARWWGHLSADPFAEFLLIWLVPNLIFDILAPAKAPRYALAHFAPVFLLAGWVLHRVEIGRTAPEGPPKVEAAWRGLYAAIMAVGVAALLAAFWITTHSEEAVRYLGSADAQVWAVLGLVWCGVAALEFRGRGAFGLAGRLLGLLAVLAATKPVMLTVVWPLRADADSMRRHAAEIDRWVWPADAVVTVLGRHELPDVAFYSRHRFRFLSQANGVEDIRARGTRYCLVREDELEDFGLEDGFATWVDFDRADERILLIDVAPPSPENPPQPATIAHQGPETSPDKP